MNCCLLLRISLDFIILRNPQEVWAGVSCPNNGSTSLIFYFFFFYFSEVFLCTIRLACLDIKMQYLGMSATSCACICCVPSPDVGSSCIIFLQNSQEFQTSSSAIDMLLPSCASELLQKCWAIEDTLLLPVVFPIFIFCHMTIGNHIFLNDLKKKKKKKTLHILPSPLYLLFPRHNLGILL